MTKSSLILRNAAVTTLRQPIPGWPEPAWGPHSGWITKQSLLRNLLEILRPRTDNGFTLSEKDHWLHRCSSKPPGLLRRSRIRALTSPAFPSLFFNSSVVFFLEIFNAKVSVSPHAPSPAHPLSSDHLPFQKFKREGIPSRNVKPHLTPFFPWSRNRISSG